MECLTEEDRRTKKDIDSPQSFEANKNFFFQGLLRGPGNQIFFKNC